MRHALPPLDRLKAFEAAARNLSFSAAADELCVSKGAISYQIRKLEDDLGIELFRREVRQVLLTDAGQLLQKQTRQCFDDLAGTLATLANQRRTEVVIAATTYVTARWLSARLARFSAARPDVELRFQHGVNDRGFSLGACDIALRWGPCPATTDNHTLRSLPMPLMPAVSPALLARCGAATSDEVSLEAFRSPPWSETLLLAEDRREDLWQLWAGAPLPHTQRVISDANVRVQAAIDGHGWILADDLMMPELQSGLLVTPIPHTLEGYGYQLLQSHTARHTAARELAVFLCAE
ncbi:MAG: LysR family transcriptional regulator [Pseudomonadota bacterium]